jgi:TfoX/Sxy family transcriptional regulator of competence genes
MAKPGMTWRKAPPELIAAFEAAFPGLPAERRKMFGYPVGFVNGNMFMGLHQEDWMVRLGEADRAALLKVPGARTFEPMPGRPMKEYIVMPPAVVADRKALTKWIAKALAHVGGLPGKAGKATKPKKKPAKKPAR